MQKNVGTIDALIRITLGLFGLAWGISRIARSRRNTFPLFMTLMSALKVAEGVVRFCPGLALFGVDSLNEDESSRKAPFPTQNYARRKFPDIPASVGERGIEKHD